MKRFISRNNGPAAREPYNDQVKKYEARISQKTTSKAQKSSSGVDKSGLKMTVSTQLTKDLGIQHPIMLAGMGQTSGAPLAAAVSNAGGLGVIGGVGYTNDMLKEMIAELKSSLKDPNLPFGVDLLIPQVGGSARKTNVDYTKGSLDQLIETIIEGGAKVFVSAVGIPPKHVVDRLHEAGVLYMNMIGHPKHVHKACKAGADIICAQGGEAGGHTVRK